MKTAKSYWNGKKLKLCHCMPKLAIRPSTNFFLQPLKVGVLQWHTHTDKQTDIATLWLNRPSRGRFSENISLKSVASLRKMLVLWTERSNYVLKFSTGEEGPPGGLRILSTNKMCPVCFYQCVGMLQVPPFRKLYTYWYKWQDYLWSYIFWKYFCTCFMLYVSWTVSVKVLFSNRCGNYGCSDH